MRFFALLFCTLGFLLAQEQEANFTIRFEPDVNLEANAQVPFAIHVTDDRHKPVNYAKVTLQIESQQNTNVQVFKATCTTDGIYIAKPVFPSSGHWKLYVEVHQGNLMSARTIEFYVPESAPS